MSHRRFFPLTRPIDKNAVDKMGENPCRLKKNCRKGLVNEDLRQYITRIMQYQSPDPHLAFTRQFVAAQPALHGFLLSLVHDSHAADDLLQELAERLWRKFDDYDDRRSFVAWGIGFARLLAMEWRRRQQRLPLPLDEETLDLLATEAAERTTHHDDRLDALRGCLKQLTDRQRAVLRSRYQEDQPVKDIARDSKRTQMAVYKMLKHVHRVLLDCIAETLARPTP